MILNGIQFGQSVPGTHVLWHGKAPRESAKNRHARAWYECLHCISKDSKGPQCGIFFSARVDDIRAGKQVSCGCRSRETFPALMAESLANLPTAVKNHWFRLAHRRHRLTKTDRLNRLTNWEIATKFNVNKYLVDFAIAEVCKSIKQRAERSYKQLKGWERAWFSYSTGTRRHIRRDVTKTRKSNRQIEQEMFGPNCVPEPNPFDSQEQESFFISALHWADRLRLRLAQEAEQAAQSAWIEATFQSVRAYSEWANQRLQDPPEDAEISMCFQAPKGWIPMNHHRLAAA